MTQVRLQLSNRVQLSHGMKEAMAQGWYAVFEVMKSEEGTLRRTSAALDAMGRVLFKRMFEEWGRFGVER